MFKNKSPLKSLLKKKKPEPNLTDIDESNLLVKQFGELNINIYGTYTDPLFKAKDIGDLLDIKNVRESIKDYNDKQKRVVSTTDSTGREQDMLFLTEQGVYKLLFKSRKQIALDFQDWVCDVIKEIRLTGEHKLLI